VTKTMEKHAYRFSASLVGAVEGVILSKILKSHSILLGLLSVCDVSSKSTHFRRRYSRKCLPRLLRYQPVIQAGNHWGTIGRLVEIYR